MLTRDCVIIAWISRKTKCGGEKMTHKNSVSDDIGDKGSVRLGMSLGWEVLRVAYIRKILLSYKKTLITTYSLVSYHGDYEDADPLPQ